MTFGMQKLEWHGYLTVKFFKDMFIRLTEFSHERNGRTPHDGIGRAYAYHRAEKNDVPP